MKIFKIGAVIALWMSAAFGASSQTRMIVMTDIGGSDPDDTQSFVHLLVSLDEVELAGIISQHAWVPYGAGAMDLIGGLIDGYEKCLPNLRVHGGKFPDASYLRSIVKQGQSEAALRGVGDGKDSEGSELIIWEVDRKDPRPVWISAWSGLNTLAQALWKVRSTRSREELNRFVSKLRVYDVLGQDDAGAWIANTFPELVYIRNSEIYGWGPSDEWIKANVQTRGVLGAMYPDRIWASEGDSPAFMYCLSNGLNMPEHPEWGGWGGRFDTVRKEGMRGMDWVAKNGLDESLHDPYFMIPPAAEGSMAIIRWKNAIYNDFAARMQWSVSSVREGANHHPVACIGRDRTKRVVEKRADSGKVIRLDSSKSYDPDGDAMTYRWSYYKEASSFDGDVTLDNASGSICEIGIPADASGKTIHIVLELTDNGSPALTSYRRVVLHVK